MASNEQAQQMVERTAMVYQKIREALQASLPVASEQLMAVQVPGTIIYTSVTGPYYWNDKEEPETPPRVKVTESGLVDGMILLSKLMVCKDRKFSDSHLFKSDTCMQMGCTAKSVARSFAGALEMSIAEDAPIDMDKSTGPKSAAAERYVSAMRYLTEPVGGTRKNVIDVYVEEQQHYSEAMAEWDYAKRRARGQIHIVSFDLVLTFEQRKQERFILGKFETNRDTMTIGTKRTSGM